MNKKRTHTILVYILLFVTLISGKYSYSQDSITNKVLIKFYPLCLIDPNRPSVQLGLEYVLKKVGIEFIYGQKYREYLPSIKNDDTSFIKSNGYNLRLDLNYYKSNIFQKNRPKLLFDYYGFELGFISNRGTNSIYYYTKEPHPDSTKVTDNYSYKQTVGLVNLKIGKYFRLNNKFYFDLYFGIGIRYIYIKTSNLEYDASKGHRLWPPDGGYVHNFLDNKRFFPNIACGLKLCYLIK